MDENSPEKSDFSYFYGEEPSQYAFYRIPKILITDKRFKISPEAKLLYGLMLDRMSLSIKNEWHDDDGKSFIFFKVEEVMEKIQLHGFRRSNR